ncbi:hypothetical protein [Roseovarius aestuarii]|uniref:Uncharacterized protein n=1 Tax=Roseovarius aestuarii TaxID=475083 RepID=A0A1X7BTB4_9RHOB|nr:hypothetical protein [Roseovarius aestuarii]SMC12848.1 hypothetical protein ROA7745_02680 [Roseovarius aestuarii]
MDASNEDWIIDAGDVVIQKRVKDGRDSLQPLDKLIYCLWVADYGMRNAGDLSAAEDVYPPFQDEAEQLAKGLNLPLTHSAFSLSSAELERQYFELFEGVCDEIRASQGK